MADDGFDNVSRIYYTVKSTVLYINAVFLPVLGIQIRMFLGLPDPDPLVRGTWILPFSDKGERNERMQIKILTHNFFYF
jgi:hypothetical protein